MTDYSGLYVVPVLTISALLFFYHFLSVSKTSSNVLTDSSFYRLVFVFFVSMHQVAQLCVLTLEPLPSTCLFLRQTQYMAGALTFATVILYYLIVFEAVVEDCSLYLSEMNATLITVSCKWLQRVTLAMTVVFVSPLFFISGEFDQFCHFHRSANVTFACCIMAMIYLGLQCLFIYFATLFYNLRHEASAIYPTQRHFNNVYTSCFLFSLQTIVALATLVLCALYFPSGRKYFFQVYAIATYALLSSKQHTTFEPLNKLLATHQRIRHPSEQRKSKSRQEGLSSISISSKSSQQPDSYTMSRENQANFAPSFALPCHPSRGNDKRRDSVDFSIASSEHSAPSDTVEFSGYVRFSDEITGNALKERQRAKAVWNNRVRWDCAYSEECSSAYGGESVYSDSVVSVGGASIGEMSDSSCSIPIPGEPHPFRRRLDWL